VQTQRNWWPWAAQYKEDESRVAVEMDLEDLLHGSNSPSKFRADLEELLSTEQDKHAN
jgi:hypothetical protein